VLMTNTAGAGWCPVNCYECFVYGFGAKPRNYEFWSLARSAGSSGRPADPT